MLIPALTPDPGDGDELLSRAEAARLFQVDPQTVTRWAKTGWLRSFRTPGGHRCYYASDIQTRLATPTACPNRRQGP